MNNDKIVRMLAYNGRISVVCANITNLVEEARKVHDLSPVMTAVFGRLLTITSIMASEMKSNKDKITVQLKGNGPAGNLLVTANNFPKLKGYVTEPHVDIPLNELIDKYNEGMKLSAFCLDELNRAKEAIYAEVDVKDNKIIEKKLDIEGDY